MPGPEEESESERVLRDRLRGLSSGAISAALVSRALRRAAAHLDTQHRALTAAWRQPLSLFNARAAAVAGARGAQAWAVAAAREGARLVGEAAMLAERAESYERQVLVAHRQARGVERFPLLWLLERLEHVAGQMRQHTPRLALARQALDDVLKEGTREEEEEEEEGGAPRKASSHWRDPDPPAHCPELPAVVLQPLGRRLRSPGASLALDLLDLALDLVEAVGRALRLLPPEYAPDRVEPPAAASQDAVDQPSKWLAVLEVAAEGMRHIFHELGACLHLGGLLGMPKITTGYWAMRGVQAPVRMMVAYRALECEDIKYDLHQDAKGRWVAPEWDQGHKPDLYERNPMVELPYVINHRTGEVVALSNAVSLYLGRVLGLNGVTRYTKLLNEQILFHIYTAWMELRALVYPSRRLQLSRRPFRDLLEAYLAHSLPGTYDKLELCLQRRGTGFLVGWRPCTADFHLWELLDQHEVMTRAHGCRSPLADFELLEAFHRRFRELPGLQRYFDSADSRLPINNKTAFFQQ